MLNLLDRLEVGLVTEQPDNPPVGGNLRWLSPADTRILVHSVYLTFVSDANAANRRVTIQGFHGSIAFTQAPAPGDQVASATINYRFAPCILGIDGTAEHTTQWAPISEHLYLEQSHALATAISNIQATDQISAVTIRYYQKLPR